MPDGLNPASAALWYGGLCDRQDVHLSVAARIRALRDHGRKNDYAVVLPHVDGPYSLAHADSQMQDRLRRPRRVSARPWRNMAAA